jgi:hypothetical protein
LNSVARGKPSKAVVREELEKNEVGRERDRNGKEKR